MVVIELRFYDGTSISHSRQEIVNITRVPCVGEFIVLHNKLYKVRQVSHRIDRMDGCCASIIVQDTETLADNSDV